MNGLDHIHPEDMLAQYRREIAVGASHAMPRHNEIVRSVGIVKGELKIIFDASAGGDQTLWHIRLVTFEPVVLTGNVTRWKYVDTVKVPTPEKFVSRRGGSESLFV